MKELDEARIRKFAADTEEALARAATMQPDPSAKEWLVEVPPYDADGVVVERFEITEDQAMVDKMRAAFNPQRSDRSTDPGTYTRLVVDGSIWMTDTPAEIRDHEAVDDAMAWRRGGSMLIAGLGLGVVLRRAIVTHNFCYIDVVEIDPRVIRAVGAHYLDLARERDCTLRLHHADIHQWRAPVGSWWDVGWFDIWETIKEDDMDEVRRLRNRFYRRLGWSGAWAQEERVAMRRRIRSGKWAY